MLNKLIISCMFLLPAQLFAGIAPVPQFIDSPPAITNNSSPIITVGGEGVTAYRYKANNGSYSNEIPISEPIRFGADIKINGRIFNSGSRDLQDYLDRRINLSLTTDFIDAVEFSNVTSEVNIVYTLNPKRVFLQDNNIFTAEGVGAEDLRPRIVRVSPSASAGLQELFVQGGVLKFDQQNSTSRMLLEIPPGANITLSPIAATDAVITINGTDVPSGAGIDFPNLSAGMTIHIICTSPTETFQYAIEIKERDFNGKAAIGYYFRSNSPAEDYLSIPNNGSDLATVSVNLNGRLFADISDVADAVLSLPDEYPGETIPRKLWRFIRDNRYHDYPVTPDSWKHNPALFFNSIGLGFCGETASLYSQLASLLGFSARVWGLDGHVIPEVLADGRWEMYDPDLEVYYYNDAGQVAGVIELAADPSLILSPRNNLAPRHSFVYSQTIADIYSTSYNNKVNDWYSSNPLTYRLFIDIPPAGRVEFPKIFVTPLNLTYDSTAKSYTNARLVVPQHWTGTVKSSLLVHAIGNEGLNSIAVVGRNDAGEWNSNPATVTYTIHTFPPIVAAFQDSGVYNAAEPVKFAVNETANIFYTLDGSTPSEVSLIYSEPFFIAQNSVVKYFAVDTAGNQSSIKSYSGPVSSIAVTNDFAPPQRPGATVTFLAAASGGSGNYEYYFVWWNPNTGKWTHGQDYSGNNGWVWDTTDLLDGNYLIQVWVRNAGTRVLYDTYWSGSYSLITPPPPATSLTVAMDRSSPLQAGGKVIFSAAAGGGSGSIEYYFTWRDPATGKWFAGQAYNRNSIWTWDTAGLSPGAYTIQVWVRSVGSLAPYEVARSTTYTLIEPPPPATSLTVAMDRASPLQAGGKVIFSAAAGGGSGSIEYYFTWRDPATGKWFAGQAYNRNSIWTWDTAGLSPGAYTIQVWARSAGSLAPYEVARSTTYRLI